MKIKQFEITGMTCGNCVEHVRSALEDIEGVEKVSVQLAYPQAEIQAKEMPAFSTIQSALADSPKYTIAPIDSENEKVVDNKSLTAETSFKPLILIVAFILGISVLVQFPFESWNWMLWMRHFMAGFFLAFAFFKLLNIPGFATSYAMYDIIAKKWFGWGYLYPFIELFLGIAYLINFSPIITNSITFLVLGISSIGVIQSNLNKRKIKCACLGDVFNLPMTTVTIIEDVTMVAMAAIMIYYHAGI